MKREDLKNLGLTDEQIEKAMAEHGKDITSLQEKVNGLTNERDGLKSQLDERDQQLVDLQKNQIKDLKTTLNTIIEQRDNAEGLLNEYRKREIDPFSGDEDNLWHGIISEEESYAFRQQLSNNEYNKEGNSYE